MFTKQGMGRVALIDGDELDLIEHPEVFRSRAGVRSKAKRRIHKRERAQVRREIIREVGVRVY